MAGPQRNLLVVLCHGLRNDALADACAWPLRTFHFETLIRRAARLTATSACPASPGGMVSLLTGLHARQHGYTSPTRSALRCDGWPLLHAEAGRHVGGVGCVGPILPHLAEEVTVADVDELDEDRCAYLSSMRDSDHFEDLLAQRRQRKRAGLLDSMPLAIEPADDIDGFIAQRAEQMLKAMPGDRPWTQIVIFSGPGNDLPPPSMYDNVVEPRLLESDFIPADLTCVDSLADLDYPRVTLQRLTRQKISRIRADYLGRVALIDFAVGRLAQCVADRSDAAQTWTVVTSDRGCLLGERGLVGYRSFLAGAVEVPVIIAPPTPVGPIHVDAKISTVDVAATIALLGGCDLSPTVTGRSLLPLLLNEPVFPAPPGDAMLCEYGRRLMLQTDRHKAVFDTETRSVIGLFDCQEDVDERHNLVNTTEGRNLLDALRWRLGDALLSLRSPT